MRHVLISSATLFAAIMPIAANAAPAKTASAQAICVPAEVLLPDGSTVEGQFCYVSGGRV